MRMTQLKTIADIQTGPFGSQLHKEDYVETGTPIVTVEHLGNRVFTEQNLPRVSDSDKARLIKYTLSTGDIVFSRVGSVDRCSYVDKSHDGWMFSGRCLRVRPTELVDSLYLYYYFCLEETKQFVRNIAVGATMPSINTKLLGEVEIALPDLNNQKRIAAVLSSLDDKIENNQKLNDNLEQQAQAIYHERFETVSPNDLPYDWRIVTLGEVVTISNKSFNPLKEPEILLEHYSIPAFDETRFPVFELSTSIKSNKFIIDASCFMISKLNPTTKRVWKPYCLTEDAVCSTEFIVYKAKDQAITDFLYSVIDSGSFSDFMCSHVTGSTGSRQRTTPAETLSYKLILPSENELAEFQSLVSPMYAQMRINAIENDKLKRLRDSLLPKLMSGEIDVSAVQL